MKTTDETDTLRSELDAANERIAELTEPKKLGPPRILGDAAEQLPTTRVPKDLADQVREGAIAWDVSRSETIRRLLILGLSTATANGLFGEEKKFTTADEGGK